MTFGLIITNRSFFPSHLVTEERNKIIFKLTKMGYEIVVLSEQDTEIGAVMTYSDAKNCAKLFAENRDKIDGIIIILPNFGTETSVADVIKISKMNVPILVQACDDDFDKLDIANRRDAFCGKLSVCNNLYQRGIKFTNTSTHTCQIESEQFSKDINYFAAVCRVVKGVSTARLGAIGARPDAFQTVRFSEKLLQASGITVSAVDLSEIIFQALALKDDDPAVVRKVTEIRLYGKIPKYISNEKVIRQAKLCITLEEWVDANGCDASAVQCWNSIQNNYGCAACLAMSMMGQKGKPSACEMDITGALTMYALYLASNEPSGYLDWNNNYMDDRDKCICLHCSNFPKSFFGTDFEIGNLDVLATTIGEEKCFGCCKAQVAPGPVTYAKITTDDKNGKIKLYVGEGEILSDKVDTVGGTALCHISGLQKLMDYICKNGFEHHVAMNRSHSAAVIEEALENYLGWDVYRHHE